MISCSDCSIPAFNAVDRLHKMWTADIDMTFGKLKIRKHTKQRMADPKLYLSTVTGSRTVQTATTAAALLQQLRSPGNQRLTFENVPISNFVR